MADISKSYVDLTRLQRYDGKIKEWANGASQIAFKSVLKSNDGNNLYFYVKPDATLSDTPDKTVALGGGDTLTQLEALASIVVATYDSSTKTYSISGLNTTAQNTLVAAINELLADIGDVSDLDVALTGETQPTDVVAAANLLASHIASVASDLETLNNKVGDIPAGVTATTVVGYVDEKVANTISGLDTTNDVGIASQSGKAITITGSIKEEDGIIADGTASDITLADVASTGAAEDVTTTAITDGELTPTQLYAAGNVQGILEAIARDLNDLETESVVNVVKDSTAQTGYLASYTITQNGTQVGEKINIPKDYLVKSASVETVTTADEPYTGAEVGDKYIDFVINVKEGTGTDEHIYLPLDDLMAAITGGTTAEATVSIDAHNVITVSIVKIAASKIAYSNTSSGSAVEETVQAALTRLDGDDTVTGSVAKVAKDTADTAVAALNTSTNVTIATEDNSTGAVSFTQQIDENSGIVGAVSGDKIVFTPVTNNEVDALFTTT